MAPRGRPKGSKNKVVSTKRLISETVAQQLRSLDEDGRTMAEIQVDAARYMETMALKELEKKRPRKDVVREALLAAAKIASGVSGYLYPSLQSVKMAGEEGGAPIRFETLSEHQLEQLIARLGTD